MNLCGSYKLIGNCKRKFKASVDHSIKNIVLREAKKRTKPSEESRIEITAKKISGVLKYSTVK